MHSAGDNKSLEDDDCL